MAISPYESHMDPRLFWPCPAAFNPLRPPIGDNPHARGGQQPASAPSASATGGERRLADGKAESRPGPCGPGPLGRVPGVHGVAGLAFGGGRYRCYPPPGSPCLLVDKLQCGGLLNVPLDPFSPLVLPCVWV